MSFVDSGELGSSVLMSESSKKVLGINGLGRIGKLTLWHHVARKHYDEIVINTGREVGGGLEAVAATIERDSTYGSMHTFLYGVNAERRISVLSEEEGVLLVDGVRVKVLREARDPRRLGWRRHGVRVAVDTTGVFADPTESADSARGALRGHLAAGAEKVILSAPFKIKDKSADMPQDSVMLIHGINHASYDPDAHDVISAASCTTTALAHMVKPLLEDPRTSRILAASMSTIHSATNSQSVLDQVPKGGASDLRKTRSVLNNIILTSTGAARALEKVIPNVSSIGFMADSVRIPTSTESLIILNLALQTELDERGEPKVNRQVVNEIYREAGEGAYAGLISYSEEQNVSRDVQGNRAAVVIEGSENHTRTSFLSVHLDSIPGLSEQVVSALPEGTLSVPVSHAKVFGWYDNEYGSYVNRLSDLTCYVEEQLD